MRCKNGSNCVKQLPGDDVTLSYVHAPFKRDGGAILLCRLTLEGCSSVGNRLAYRAAECSARYTDVQDLFHYSSIYSNNFHAGLKWSCINCLFSKNISVLKAETWQEIISLQIINK